jgi:CheY-like chemotaxis protein
MTRPLHILLVEDNPADAELTSETIMAGRLSIQVTIVKDGVEAVDFLRRNGAHAGARRPDVILLDLNLPRKDGREVLASIKEDSALHDIPVIVLSSSEAPRDVANSYQLGANCYVTKPVDLHAYREAVRTLEDFWLTLVKLPPGDGPRPISGGAP